MYQNKWTGSLYEKINTKGNEVTLKKCEDNSVITILIKEFVFSYREYKPKGGKKNAN